MCIHYLHPQEPGDLYGKEIILNKEVYYKHNYNKNTYKVLLVLGRNFLFL